MLWISTFLKQAQGCVNRSASIKTKNKNDLNTSSMVQNRESCAREPRWSEGFLTEKCVSSPLLSLKLSNKKKRKKEKREKASRNSRNSRLSASSFVQLHSCAAPAGEQQNASSGPSGGERSTSCVNKETTASARYTCVCVCVCLSVCLEIE